MPVCNNCDRSVSDDDVLLDPEGGIAACTHCVDGEDFADYGDPQRGVETDIVYRIRDDGKMVALFDAQAREFLAAMRIEDAEAILRDLHEHEAAEAY